MQIVLFSVFAIAALTGALGVIFTRSPVNSAVGLVITMFAVAAIYFLLGAYFVGIVQVVVYAGAIVVLFLFVIMLLNVGSANALRERFTRTAWAGILLGVGFVAISGAAVWAVAHADMPVAATASAALGDAGHTRQLARLLFQHYALLFEVVSIVLLTALVGVTLLVRFHGRLGDEDSAAQGE